MEMSIVPTRSVDDGLHIEYIDYSIVRRVLLLFLVDTFFMLGIVEQDGWFPFTLYLTGENRTLLCFL